MGIWLFYELNFFVIQFPQVLHPQPSSPEKRTKLRVISFKYQDMIALYILAVIHVLCLYFRIYVLQVLKSMWKYSETELWYIINAMHVYM
jgi:hypothetical protein